MDFTHMNQKGQIQQVNVGAKPVVHRTAKAQGKIFMAPHTLQKIGSNDIQKGNVLETARLSAIMASKKTSDLIPLCHTLLLDHVGVEFKIHADHIEVETSVETCAKTGVEMEALKAVMVGLLTIYDMCKAIDATMRFEGIRLLQKTKDRKGKSLC